MHQNTLAADLERAEEGLNQDLKQRNNELKKLVKENFDCFISCKNTIDGECIAVILTVFMSFWGSWFHALMCMCLMRALI